MFFHGGAFVLGDRYTEELRCLRYAAEAGCVVVSVDYRLAPEHPFPAAVDDCYAGLEWTVSHAAELGIDPSRVGVGGSSAGGALAAAVALMARDRGGPALAVQILNYPVIDDRMQTPSMRAFDATPMWTSGSNADMWQHYLGDPESRGEVSALRRSGAGHGPDGPSSRLRPHRRARPPARRGHRVRDAGSWRPACPPSCTPSPGACHGFDIIAAQRHARTARHRGAGARPGAGTASRYRLTFGAGRPDTSPSSRTRVDRAMSSTARSKVARLASEGAR